MTKKSLSGKTQVIWKICQKTGKTQGILPKHRVFLILKINDIETFPVEFSHFSKELNVSAKSVLHIKHPQITEIGTGNICSRTGKTGNLKIEDPDFRWEDYHFFV